MDKKTPKNNVRKLTRLGRYSLTVTLPKDIISELGWKEGQKVVAEKYGKGIYIKDWQK
jgi:bifunctional DNA-binding transcriptional regulator/antitoxin component of YhaV-PrlF toxin-antitoxin module